MSKRVRWTDEEERFVIDNYKEYTNDQLAVILNKTPEQVGNKKRNLKLKGGKGSLKDYAIYRGDEFIIWGNIPHLSKELNVGEEWIRKLATRKLREKAEQQGNMMYAIRIED